MTGSELKTGSERRSPYPAPWALAAALAVVALASVVLVPTPGHAQDCAGYTVCPTIYLNRNNFPEQQQADAVIATTEKSALASIKKASNTPQQLRELLGEVILFDKTLSVNSNLACNSCHSRISGFTGPISTFNAGPVAYNGSSGVRAGPRRVISYGYAPFTPVLHFDTGKNNFVGGEFSDMRATGLITGNPAADQALGPFLSPEEYGMPDPACVVFRISQGLYTKQFEKVWGTSSFKITFPANVATLCSIPSTSNDPNPQVLALSDTDRAQAVTTFQNVGLSIATFETSTLVSPFTSKFDQVQAGTAGFTAQEQQGLQAFMGRTSSQAPCHICHDPTGSPAMFTNFEAFNIGVPKNTNLPFYNESLPDDFGYIANPAGLSFVDLGVGNFLRNSGNPTWAALAPQFDGTFEVPSLRNTAKIAHSSFIKAHTHNGFFTSVAELVHFYFTRDLLNQCGGSTVTVGVDCWPPSEVLTNRDTHIGSLGTGFAATDEANIVTFLNTLTDTKFSPL